MGFFDSALKLGGKAATLGGKVFGLGKGRLSFRDKKILGKHMGGLGHTGTVKGNPWGAAGQTAAKIAAIGTGTNLLQNAIGDAGPEGDEFMERAYNQIRYGVDMTDAQMEEAAKGGMEFQDTGLIGEGGLNEEQVLKYIEQEAQDKRGKWEKAASAGLSGLAMVPGLSTILGTPAEVFYDKAVGDTRRLSLKNAVENLKLDANTIKMRKDMEKKQGKFMAQGLLGKDFGTGNVSGISRGGVKPPVDREAIAEEAAALKEYEAIKERDGVFAALAHPSALKAGRQVYLDVQEASDGDKNTAEALLSGVGGQEGVGLTDQETMERYYGNPEKNALNNRITATEAMLSSAAKEAAAKQTAAEQAQAQEKKSGPVNLTPASTPEQVKNNIATIAASRSYYGEPDVASQQREYFRKRGVSTSADLNERLEAAADKAYADANNGMSRHSSDAINALYRRHGERLEQSKRQYIENRKRMADIEYDKYIVKPGDPNYKLSPPVTASTPDEMAQADRDSAASMGDGSLPAQVNQSANTPGIPSNIAPPRPNPGLIPPTVRPTVPPATAPTAMSPTPYGIGTANRGSGLPSFSPPRLPSFSPPRLPSNVMKPTPYGLGTATPGMPQVPDIGAPVRNAVENALTRRSSGPANVMAPTPYGLGTATPGVPQVPDIGAPARDFGEKVAGGVMDMYGRIQAINPFAQGTAGHTGWNYANTMGGGPAGSERRQLENAAGEQRFQAEEALNGGPANRPLSPSEIAKMLAEDKLKEEQRVKGMKMPSKSGPTPRFYHPTQGPNNRPY